MRKLVFLLSAVFILSSSLALAEENATGDSTVNINNTSPTIETIFLSDVDGVQATGGMDLSAGTTQTIYCYGTYNDEDGLGDVQGVSARIWNNGLSSFSGSENLEEHYRNETCSAIDGDFSCEFDVEFFARPGTWNCNATVVDTSLDEGTGQASETMNELLGISIPENLLIDFGSVGLGATSTSRQVPVNNTGNINLDFGLDAFRAGNTTSDTEGMNCSIAGTIPTSNFEVSADDTTFDNLVGLGPMYQLVTALSPATDISPTPTTQDVFWRLSVPSVGVGGSCSGKVYFEAIAN